MMVFENGFLTSSSQVSLELLQGRLEGYLTLSCSLLASMPCIRFLGPHVEAPGEQIFVVPLTRAMQCSRKQIHEWWSTSADIIDMQLQCRFNSSHFLNLALRQSRHLVSRTTLRARPACVATSSVWYPRLEVLRISTQFRIPGTLSLTVAVATAVDALHHVLHTPLGPNQLSIRSFYRPPLLKTQSPLTCFWAASPGSRRDGTYRGGVLLGFAVDVDIAGAAGMGQAISMITYIGY